MATWTTCWAVVDAADRFVECVASRTEHSVTVRNKRATHGGKRFKPAVFEENFGATPGEAIEKYLVKYRALLQSTERDVEALAIIIRRAEALQELQRTCDEEYASVSFHPTKEQLEKMRKTVEEPQ
jgi:hypothetical protein